MPALHQPDPSLARQALIPFSVVASFVVVYVLGAPPWTLLPMGVSLTLLYIAAPWLGTRAMAGFDRDAIDLLGRDDARGLQRRWRRAWAMRVLAPPALVAQRGGMVAAQVGAHERALASFQRAAAGYPKGDVPIAVRLGMAHAASALGRDDDAIELYRELHATSSGLPRVALGLAHSLARKGEHLREAADLADRAMASGETGAALVRALVHARRGERGAAKRLFAAHSRGADADLAREVRTAISPKKKKAATKKPARKAR